MIRDPSDGSVKEPLPKPIMDAWRSALQTGSQKPENLERLERSREWLRNYRKKDLVQSTTEIAEAPIGHPSSEDVA